MAGAEAYLRAKFRLDPFKRLPLIYQCHGQTGQTYRHKTVYSIGRTVLQTVPQKFVLMTFLKTKLGRINKVNGKWRYVVLLGRVCVCCTSKPHIQFIMAALWNRAGHYIFALWFLLLLLLLSSFFFFSSPNLSSRRVDVYHTSTHSVDLVRMLDAGLKCAARGSLETQDAKMTQKIAILAPSHNFGLYLRS